MARPVFKSKATRPARRDQPRLHFFPGEAARILGLRDIDYYQLRRVFDLVASGTSRERAKGPSGRRRWARYTFRDLVAAKLAIKLAGGPAVLKQPGRKLALKPIEDACKAVRTRLTSRDPLLAARWGRIGSTVVAEIDGLVVDPVRKQLMIEQVFEKAVERIERSEPDDEVASHMRVISDELRAAVRITKRSYG